MATMKVATVVIVACLMATSGVDAWRDRIVGTTAVNLDHTRCKFCECTMANFVNRAIIKELVPCAEPGAWTLASIAVNNAGTFRASISEYTNPGGAFSYNELQAALPWNNTYDIIDVPGSVIKEALELSATKIGTNGFLQWSGLTAVYDLSAPVNSKVSDIKVVCRICREPSFEPLVPCQWYRVAMADYLVDGGFGYTMFQKNLRTRVVGRLDKDIVVDYSARSSPITQFLDGRMINLNC